MKWTSVIKVKFDYEVKAGHKDGLTS